MPEMEKKDLIKVINHYDGSCQLTHSWQQHAFITARGGESRDCLRLSSVVITKLNEKCSRTQETSIFDSSKRAIYEAASEWFQTVVMKAAWFL